MSNSEKWRLLHDNPSSHFSIIVRRLLPEKEVKHPLHLTPCGFSAVFKIKNHSQKQFFEDVKTVKRNVTSTISGIPYNEFQKPFQRLYGRSCECVTERKNILNFKIKNYISANILYIYLHQSRDFLIVLFSVTVFAVRHWRTTTL